MRRSPASYLERITADTSPDRAIERVIACGFLALCDTLRALSSPTIRDPRGIPWRAHVPDATDPGAPDAT